MGTCIQACNPEIQSCDVSSSTDLSHCDLIEQNACEPTVEFFTPDPNFEKFQNCSPFMSRLWAETPTAPLASFDYPDDQKTREAKLGSYLASLPPSSEEKIPPIVGKTPLMTETAYSLTKVWAQLPTQVRVYLESMNLKNSPELGISYESEDPNLKTPGRWHVFEMNQATLASAAGAGVGVALLKVNAGGEPPRMIPPKNQPTLNVSLGTALLGTGLVIGIDLGIRKAFPNLSTEAMIGLNFGTFYGTQYLFYRFGMIEAETWSQVWKPSVKALPTMMTVGLSASAMLDLLGQLFNIKGLEIGSNANFLGANLLTLGTFYTMMGTETGMRFMAGTGEGLAGALGFGAKWLGRALIVGAAWVIGKGIGNRIRIFKECDYSDDACWGRWRTWQWAENVVIQTDAVDTFGRFGGTLVLGTGLWEMFGDFARIASDGIDEAFNRIQKDTYFQLIQESQNFGQFLRRNIALMIADSINMKTGEIEWGLVADKIKAFYSDETDQNPSNDTEDDNNETIIDRGYDALDKTAFAAPEAEEIKKLIEKDGSIILDDEDEISPATKRALAQIALLELQKTHEEQNQELRRLGESIGNIKTIGNQTFAVPPPLLTPQQRIRMDQEYIPLYTQIVFLKAGIEKISKQLQ